MRFVRNTSRRNYRSGKISVAWKIEKNFLLPLSLFLSNSRTPTLARSLNCTKRNVQGFLKSPGKLWIFDTEFHLYSSISTTRSCHTHEASAVARDRTSFPPFPALRWTRVDRNLAGSLRSRQRVIFIIHLSSRTLRRKYIKTVYTVNTLIRELACITVCITLSTPGTLPLNRVEGTCAHAASVLRNGTDRIWTIHSGRYRTHNSGRMAYGTRKKKNNKKPFLRGLTFVGKNISSPFDSER